MFAFDKIRELLLIVLIAVGWIECKEAEKPYIDFLTLDYLSVEQKLWAQINSGIDLTTLYSAVLEEHKEFIRNDFGVSSNTQTIYIPAGILIDNLRHVNNLFYNVSGMLVYAAPIESIDIYYVHRILRNSIAYSEHVFNEAIRAEFWENGKNYVKHCRQLEASTITIESEFQLIYNYYKDVRAALLKTYILTQLSHMLINIHNKAKGNDIPSAPYDLKDELFHRVELIRRNVKNLLKIARRDSWVCERFPYTHGKDQTEGYEQFTKFLQGYIDHELNFNNESTCTNSCEDYTETEHIRCESKTLCAQNRRTDVAVCSGSIRNCVELDSDDIQICFGDNDDRRYHYLKYSDGTQFGQEENAECSTISHARSWRRWFVKCSSCYCFCDDSNGSDRHFSLYEVVSDIENNKVITGVRLVKENGVIQLSISERTLLPFGQTSETEQDTWILADDQFAVTDIGVVDGIDYATLTYENRTINLDDLVLPQGKLVTGVRFQQSTSNGHLALEIRATDFDYFSGRLLNISHNPWVKNENGGQIEIEIPKKRSPLQYIVKDLYMPETVPNAYVKFGPSDLDFDVGQTTVPLIETYALESRNPVALGGIGLTYKSNNESAGFIALKTFTYDFSISDADDEYDYID